MCVFIFYVLESCSIFRLALKQVISHPPMGIDARPHQDRVGARKWDLFQPLIAALGKVFLQRLLTGWAEIGKLQNLKLEVKCSSQFYQRLVTYIIVITLI